ncbi:WhiB family transcriptional regulator [Streptomyces sp. NPDC085942]|uniref:WhiB family transcriptional regulator n=1 Tax=Streptomyces sp. NPDC085942 TaxID=3365743 RepID=UPI0037D8C9FC
MRTTRMTSAQAQQSRRAVLQTAIDTGSRCAGGDLDHFFREDNETTVDWVLRRTDAIRVCASCPARAACEELVLRSGDGDHQDDYMVRAGLTGPELAAARDDQAERLAAAVDLDRDTEGQRLDTLSVKLRRTAAATPSRGAEGRTEAEAQGRQNTQVRELAARVGEIRSARRARAGWGGGGGMRTTTLPRPSASVTGTCPACGGTFETCRCTGGVAVLARRTGPVPAPAAAGGYGGWEDEDNQRGYERDETDQYHRLVRRLTDHGDGLAAAAGRRARRTFAEMAPGQSRQPVLLMTRPLTFTPTVPAGPVAGRACGSCGGAGGKTVDTSSGGVSRQHWQTCTTCSGTGEAR